MPTTTLRKSPSGSAVDLRTNNITNDSIVPGDTVTEALDYLDSATIQYVDDNTPATLQIDENTNFVVVDKRGPPSEAPVELLLPTVPVGRKIVITGTTHITNQVSAQGYGLPVYAFNPGLADKPVLTMVSLGEGVWAAENIQSYPRASIAVTTANNPFDLFAYIGGTVLIDATAGAITVNLPIPFDRTSNLVPAKALIKIVANPSSNLVTLVAEATSFIDGAATYVLSNTTKLSSVEIVWDPGADLQTGGWVIASGFRNP
jgi:hypothetical protein